MVASAPVGAEKTSGRGYGSSLSRGGARVELDGRLMRVPSARRGWVVMNGGYASLRWMRQKLGHVALNAESGTLQLNGQKCMFLQKVLQY